MKRVRVGSEDCNDVLSITVYPKKYAHGFCFAVLCCGYTLTDFPISIRLTSLALWQSNDCPSASEATLMNIDKYFMWIHYERLHNHNKAKHNKTVCIFVGIYCRPGGINFSEILIKTHYFSFMKMHQKISSAKWQPFCPGGYELNENVNILYMNIFVRSVEQKSCSNRTLVPLTKRGYHTMCLLIIWGRLWQCFNATFLLVQAVNKRRAAIIIEIYSTKENYISD